MSSSLLLSLSSKLSLRNLALQRSSHALGTRMMFTSTTTNPYLMQCVTFIGEDSYGFPKPGAKTSFLMLDPAKEETLFVEGKPYPKELFMSRLVGSSHGWGLFLADPKSILLSDFCSSNNSNHPKFIHLFPRRYPNGWQADLVSGFAMSSSPDEQGCFTGLNYTGGFQRVDTPGRLDNEVAAVCTRPSFPDYFQHSKLMYSKRDRKFYMASSGGHHLWSWDGLTSTVFQYHDLRFHNLPRFSPSELQLLNSCYRTHHLVECPSGQQRFLVRLYAQCLPRIPVTFDCGGTKRFMVFREEEDRSMSYTQDIGDLCMFLGNNEPFCLEASSFPGLKPNSIYFVGQDQGYGVYDIANGTISGLCTKSPPPVPEGEHNMVPHWLPHWLPPSPL